MMTRDQFNAIAELIRMRDGASQAAAKLVLVDGASQAAAARVTGVSVAGVSNAVMRCRRAMELAKTAAGISSCEISG